MIFCGILTARRHRLTGKCFSKLKNIFWCSKNFRKRETKNTRLLLYCVSKNMSWFCMTIRTYYIHKYFINSWISWVSHRFYKQVLHNLIKICIIKAAYFLIMNMYSWSKSSTWTTYLLLIILCLISCIYWLTVLHMYFQFLIVLKTNS